MKILKTLYALLIVAVVSTSLMAQNPYLVKDIYPGTASFLEGGPLRAVGMNNILYFSANNGINGSELWRSDGTEAGTYLLKDINPNGNAYGHPYLAVANILYFIADNGINGVELWKSDGTSNGTVLVKDIWSGSSSSSPENLNYVNGNIYFRARVGQYRVSHMTYYKSELFKTNGTANGTVIVKAINPKGREGGSPASLMPFQNQLFFAGLTVANGWELWKSDGSANGTVLVKDIWPGTGSGMQNTMGYGDRYSFKYGPAILNNELYIRPQDGINCSTTNNYSKDLWKTNGTTAGTTLLKPCNIDMGYLPLYLTEFNGKVYFTTNEGDGFEMWETDGTVLGTKMTFKLNSNGESDPRTLTNLSGYLFFSADDGIHGRELWKYDGVNNPELVKDINPGGSSDPNFAKTPNYQEYYGGRYTLLMGKIYFTADDGQHGYELWVTDGTEAGTSMIADINPGLASSGPRFITNVNGTLYFAADDGIHGLELWRYIPPLNAPMDVETLQADNYRIDFYPNPASELLTINGEFKNNVNLNIKIFDLLGIEMINTEKSSVSRISEQIDISTFPAGMYIINFRFNGQSVQQKFIKK